tara:strand:- start:513 stop:809 length:297 start_codon:yes stop_codon:yes gene_type:complete
MAKFERSDEYEAKLFGQAMFDDKKVIKDALVSIRSVGGKYKAYCEDANAYLQFPRGLRDCGLFYTCDVVEVIRTDNVKKYYRAVKGSIREHGSDEVLA